ncbi:sensor domain-containing phosphodiesterase [Noviherbaspirillum galbum]|uniref:EAL domain-containing protein n=1 Tax=Noviherbaspirillum galbum TaxID=2709383 RepID=A0A6B3SP59_9BURK|nr:EAL domain-containing protein [Noviherbaspirillum galbum]NEX62298.1 EAL domain-containing protein [Noviherbaspirillum galbum]
MDREGSCDESRRLFALAEYGILDTSPEGEFDDIVRFAGRLCGTPMAMIALLDDSRQWFKARIGLAMQETARSWAFCNETISRRELYVVSDASRDPLHAGSPLVTGPPYIRFYAGVPLISRDGYALGTIAVLDSKPRELEQSAREDLDVLARGVMARLELRRHVNLLESLANELRSSKDELFLSHRDMEERVREKTEAFDRIHGEFKREIAERIRQATETRAVVDSLPGLFYVFDTDWRFVYWNRQFERVTGKTHRQIAGASPLDFIAPSQHALLKSRMEDVIRDGSATVEADLLAGNGKRIPHFFTGTRIHMQGKVCVCGMAVDITERRRAEKALRLRDRAVRASVNAIIITDLEGKMEYANPAFERMTGYGIEEAMGRNCRFLQGDDSEQPGILSIRRAIRMQEEGNALLRNYRKDGTLFWNDLHIAPVPNADGEVTHFVGVLNDVTGIKTYEEQLEMHANVDTLTGLANRNVLKERIDHAITSAQRQRGMIAVGFIDLDNFKFINDSLGHNIGDELLKRVAERLASCLRGQDTIARYGGDEFAFVLAGQSEEKSVGALMDRILKVLDRPFHIDGNKLFISCSIGLSFYPRDGEDVDTLLKNADAAMYRAKDKGRNNFQFYTAAMNQRVTERLSLESKLRQALASDEFVLHYQPKVELASGRIVGVEALLRWNPPQGGLVAPGTFIPLAEETGLIVPIGEWVLYTACSHIRSLRESGIDPVQVAVNISARQFESSRLVDLVSHVLMTSGLEASLLELELTESLIMQNPEEVIRILLDLKEMGLNLSIDDFGTGYSSLSYLQRLPVDRLKIDQSFVRDIGADPNDAVIARAVISLGHSLGLSVVAEGVSSAEQLTFLRENGCDEMQGFLFSQAVPIHELALLLQEDRKLLMH